MAVGLKSLRANTPSKYTGNQFNSNEAKLMTTRITSYSIRDPIDYAIQLWLRNFKWLLNGNRFDVQDIYQKNKIRYLQHI